MSYEAGRELDALIAEKVMGIPEDSPQMEFDGPPAYSTDIASAWQVVEKLQAFNPFWNRAAFMDFDLSPTDPKGWTCNFGDDNTREYADTVPHAICLAALKMVGHE